MTWELPSPRGFISLFRIPLHSGRGLETWQGFHRWDRLAKLLKTEQCSEFPKLWFIRLSLPEISNACWGWAGLGWADQGQFRRRDEWNVGRVWSPTTGGRVPEYLLLLVLIPETMNNSASLCGLRIHGLQANFEIVASSSWTDVP
jgi:hypothetical protein